MSSPGSDFSAGGSGDDRRGVVRRRGGGSSDSGKQLELSRKATGAQLLLQVDDVLRQYDETIRSLREGTLEGDEFEVDLVMAAMERLHILVAKGLVDVDEIDDLPARVALDALLGNEKGRAEIARYGWTRLYDLERRLADHRSRRTRRRALVPDGNISAR